MADAPYMLLQLSDGIANTVDFTAAGADFPVPNGGFETAGGGGADTFGSWLESPSDGAIARTTEIGEIRSGVAAAKMTAGASPLFYPQMYQQINWTAGHTYRLTIWTRGDGTYAGRVSVLGGILGTTSTLITATTYGRFTADFTPGASGTQPLVLTGPPTTGGICYFDDVTLQDLTLAPPYALVDGGWSPNVAGLRQALLGAGEYAEVEESITIDIRGSTGSECLANLTKLNAILDQATRFGRGEPVNPVVCLYQPQGSALTDPVRSLVVGGRVELPVGFNDKLMIYEIPDVKVTFVRRGLWLADPVTIAAGSAVALPGPASTAASTALTTPSPTRLMIHHSGGGTMAYPYAGYLLSGPLTALQVVLGVNLTRGPTGVTTVAEATTALPGGSLVRYTPVSTAEVLVMYATPTLPAGTRTVALFAVVRNAGSTVFNLRGRISDRAGDHYTPTYALGTTTCTAIYLGTMQVGDGMTAVGILAAASAAASFFDTGYIAMISLDSPSASVVGYSHVSATLAAYVDVLFDPRALTQISPAVYNTNPATGYQYAYAYNGNAFLATSVSNLAAVVLAPAPNYWTQYISAAVPMNIALSAVRWPAYLSPP